MTDDSESEGFNFGYIDRTEVEGPIEVEDVVAVEVGKVPLPHELDDPDDAANPDTKTLWIARGDTWRKQDDELGTFDITIMNIFEVEQEDREEAWYEVEVKHKPVIHDEDSERTDAPLIQKQSIQSFAQEAVTFEAKEDAGLAPEERTPEDN